MKKLLCLLLFLSITFGVIAQPQWVTFTDPSPSAPRITLQSSSNQQVKYLIEIQGMYREPVVVGQDTYQRLSIPKAGVWGIPGYPELPAITKLIAVPECDSIIISYLVTDSIVLNNYNVYPNPLLVEDSINGVLVEQFFKVDSIYLLNQFMPWVDHEILSDGYLRNQRTARIAAYPIKYNPVTKQLVAYTEIEVSLSFQNAQEDVNITNGLLSNITKNTLLNYTLTNDQLPPSPAGTPGTVSWVTLQVPDDANNLVTDYLIITDDPFFSPQSQALQSLAQHRATFNGFDVVIVSVDNILGLNFEYTTIDPYLIAEQKIRSFIKRVYEGQHAAHTYDGHVAFVCLVGDAFGNVSTDGVPVSYDPDPTHRPGFPGEFWSPNDYYYTCVTQVNNNWDDIGDFFIGRLCSDDEPDLSNIVAKIKHNENEYSFEDWRYINTLAFGGAMSTGLPQPEIDYFTVDLPIWLNQLYEPVYSTVLINKLDPGNWKPQYIAHINSPGSNIVFHYGHGTPERWSPDLTLDYKITHMSNAGKYPFVISQSCHTGEFANISPPDCMGEEMLLFNDTCGYVAYLGSYRVGGGATTQPGEFPHTLQERIFAAIYQDLSTVLGEAVLEARIGVLGDNPAHFQHNLFGDPALNLMALGYEITQNTSLPPDPPLPQTTTISTKVYVRPGVTLSLDDGAVLEFSDNGQLIIDNGAILALGNNVTIKGQSVTNKIRIEGVICGPGGNINNPVPISNLVLNSLPGKTWKGMEFSNPDLIVKMNGCSISNCKISGELTRLELSASTSLLNSGIALNQSGLLVDGCSFTNANILLTNSHESGVFAQVLNSSFQNSTADALIRIEHYPAYSIQNCTLNYDHGTGIDLYFSGNRNGQYLIKNNTVQKSGSSQDMSWGIKVYNSFADIENNYLTNNRYGIASLNQSQVQLIGNPSASSSAETQRIINNYQNQVRATDNSFPFYFHYNIVQNSPTGNTYLVYYDPIFPDPPPIESTFNVKCNCFDNSSPYSQLYPLGWYSWSIWCPPAFCQYDGQGGAEFDAAMSSMEAEDFSTAETQFKTVIESYPGSSFAKESAKKLIPLKNLSDKDFPGLKIYFDSTVELHQDSLTDHLVYRLKNKCDVEMENYVDAITWFENDILFPASEQDSLFSLIDLSDTYMLMEADSSLKSTQNYTGSLAQYKPKNRESYVEQREEWVKLLFSDDPNIPEEEYARNQDETNLIRKIIPNPFNESTEVWIDITEPGTITLEVYNQLGQEMAIVSRQYPETGLYSMILDLSGFSNGVYLIIAKLNGKEEGKAKALKFN